MRATKKNSTGKARPAKPRRAPLGERETRLVVVEAEPIRQEWLERLAAVRRDEARWEARLAAFEREGRAAYEAWLQQHFASLRADVLRLAEEVRGFEMVADEVYCVAERLGVSEGRAYAIVKGMIPDPTGYLGRLRSGEIEDEEERPADDLPEDGMTKEFVQTIAHEMFIDFLRAQGFSRKAAENVWKDAERRRLAEEGADAGAAQSVPAGRERASDPVPSAETKARELFRQIARRLHPDAGAGAMDERKLRLWHQAQEAWSRRDVDALEAVLWETGPEAAARGEGGIGLLARVVGAVRARIRELQRRWQQIRETPAGQLAGMDPKQRERFRRQFQGQLERDLVELKIARSELQEREWDWQRAWERELAKVRKAEGKRRPKLAQQQAELPF